MTDIPEGWVQTPGLTAGAHYYRSDRYPGWKVYDVARGGAVTIYRDGESVHMASSVEHAIGWVENYVRRHEPAKEPKSPEDLLAEAAVRLIVSISERNLADKNGSASVYIPRHTVQELQEAVEAIYPGWIAAIYKGIKDDKKAGQVQTS